MYYFVVCNFVYFIFELAQEQTNFSLPTITLKALIEIKKKNEQIFLLPIRTCHIFHVFSYVICNFQPSAASNGSNSAISNYPKRTPSPGRLLTDARCIITGNGRTSFCRSLPISIKKIKKRKNRIRSGPDRCAPHTSESRRSRNR
jgi:hypothetical protein